MPAFQPYYYFIDRPYLPKSHKYVYKKTKKIVAKVLLLFGLALIVWVAYPLVSWQLVDRNRLAKETFLFPGGSTIKTWAATSSLEEIDYTRAENWFPSIGTTVNRNEVSLYTLSIPKLKINNAQVSLSGEDLTKNLVHYGGTAVPGTPGNGVIFGHSILPQFYNPKNYMAIFSTLHTLDNGDAILLAYDGVTYQYQVIDMFEVSPKDISVLDQNYDDQYITLITCTPPGTYLRRLIVKAKLVPYEGGV